MELTRNGKVVVVTSIFRMIFGGYLIGNDLYRLNDANSALEVLLIYGVIGLFAALFVVSKRYGRFGLLGLIGLDVLFIGAQFDQLVDFIVDVCILSGDAHILPQS